MIKLGSIWRVKGKKTRVIVCDRTFGGDVVFIYYRLRNSIRKTHELNQFHMSESAFLAAYVGANHA